MQHKIFNGTIPVILIEKNTTSNLMEFNEEIRKICVENSFDLDKTVVLQQFNHEASRIGMAQMLPYTSYAVSIHGRRGFAVESFEVPNLVAEALIERS